MLTVLYGPSSVGKTSIQEVLISQYGWTPVRCFTTRPPRPLDIGRVHVTNEEYESMERQGNFALSNRQFGCLYGTSKADIIQAQTSCESHFVLDFRIVDYKQLIAFNHRKVIVFVESESQLERQVSSAGRSSRRDEILLEYRTHYSSERIKTYQASGFDIIINRFGQIEMAAHNIVNLWQ